LSGQIQLPTTQIPTTRGFSAEELSKMKSQPEQDSTFTQSAFVNPTVYPFPFEERNLFQIGVAGGSGGGSDAGKTLISLYFIYVYAKHYGLGVMANIGVTIPDVDSVKVRAVKNIVELPFSRKKLRYVVLLDELDKVLFGRNYGNEWNKIISKILGDIRRKGVPLLVVNGQAKHGIDTNVRENSHIWVIPTRKSWVDGDGKRYPTYWVFPNFDAFARMQYNKHLGSDFSGYATLYRTDVPLEFLESLYDKNEPVPLCWDESFSNSQIDDMVAKFLDFCETEEIILPKSQNTIALHIRRWLRERDKALLDVLDAEHEDGEYPEVSSRVNMPLQSPDVDRLISRVVAFCSREKEKPELVIQSCSCGRTFATLKDLQKHYMAVDTVFMGQWCSSYRSESDRELVRMGHKNWELGWWKPKP